MPQQKFPGWNPARRNKRIGTTDQGFKARNDFGIPTSREDDRLFWQKIRNPVTIPYTIGSHEFAILVEPTDRNYKYYVSISDMIEVLRHIPQDDRRDIKVFAFRQPKRKEAIFSHSWGRLGYHVYFGKYSGPTVFLEAQPVGLTYRIENNVDANFKQEIEKLAQEGHQIELTKRHFDIRCPPAAIRNTQLYRTLIHEIGHQVDYFEKVTRPSEAEDADEDLQERYFSLPSRQKEHFAERYAAEMVSQLGSKNIIPFDPLPISTDRHPEINPEWFYFG
jgi:hypothetical protein